MNRKLMTLLVLGTLAATAQAQQSDRPAFFKASLLRANGDQTVYNGGRLGGFGYELGYDYAMPDQFSFITPWIGFARWNGNPRPDLQAQNPGAVPPRFDLTVWRGGVDFKWNTPVNNLKGWMGINFNFFDGNQLTRGAVPGMTGTAPKPFYEGKGKLGLRTGLDYNINKLWSAHLQFDAGYWLASSSKPRYRALNPMNPSWWAVSVGYHF
jgi:hypothetical protein